MKSLSNRRYENYISNLMLLPEYHKNYEDTLQAYGEETLGILPIDNRLYLLTLAPALLGFVNWVITDAIAKGKDRLYFLSRDGYQMYLIAKRLVELRGLELDCRYLKASRFSMRVPGYHLNLEDAIDSICVGGIDVTIPKILKRGALSDQECQSVMDELGLSSRKDEILNYKQVIALKQTLRQSKKLLAFIELHSREAYGNAMSYLIQEGLCQDDRYAIVDSGWIGTLQCSIETLVQTTSPEIHLQGYYFGMYELPAKVNPQNFMAYYFSATHGLGRKSRFSNSLFETIVSAPEGMTMAYALSEEGVYEPVEFKNTNPNEGQMIRNIKALELFLANMKVDYLTKGNIIFLEQLIENNLKLFMAHPSKLEVLAYGCNRFSDDLMDTEVKEVAGKLTWEQITDQRFLRKLLIVLGIRKKTIYESAWLEGSVARYCFTDKQIKDEDSLVTRILAKKEFWHIAFYKRIIFKRKEIQTRGSH